MTPNRLKKLSLLEQVDLMDGERIAELLLAPGSGANNIALLAIGQELLRRQHQEKGELPKAGFRECQWIERDPSESDLCKCPQKTASGSPWCSEHGPLVWDRKSSPDPGFYTPAELDWLVALPAGEGEL